MNDLATTQNEGGNAGEVADLTAQAGTSDDSQDLTEQATVEGLSRTVTRLKKQIAAISSSSSTGDPEEVANLKRELDSTKSELKKRDLALKYPDVAPFLMKAMEKKLDPELVDDEFVAAIREGKGKTEASEEEVEVGHNPQRGNLSKEQQDEALLRALPSLFSLGQ